jgi:hypothetical protein
LRAPVTARRWDSLLLAGLLALGAGLPLVMGLVAGSLEIPRNDDWVYRRIALELAHTGVLDLHGVTAMMAGQIVAAQPFLWLSGVQTWGFAVAGTTFAIAAVLFAYLLTRQFLSPQRAALATSLLLIFPAYLAYATSFMTDVPAMAGQFACVALGVIALRQRPIRSRWVLASAVVGCLAFSIREFAFAAPASVLLAVICAEPRRVRHWGLAVAVTGVFVSLSLLKGKALGTGISEGGWLQTVEGLSSMSLVLLPAAIVAMKRRATWRRFDVILGAELGLLVVGVRVLRWFYETAIPPGFMWGGVASVWGAPPQWYVIGGRPLLFDDVFWVITGLLALVSTVLVTSVAAGVVGAHVRRHHESWRVLVARLGSPSGLLVVFAIAGLGGLTLYGLRYPVFDRYYWPFIPVLATLFLFETRSSPSNAGVTGRRWKRSIASSAAVTFSLVALLSLLIALNSLAFDGARWRAGERLAQLGVSPENVDAGYEWVGYYQRDLPGVGGAPPEHTFYEGLWPGRRVCGFVSSRMEVNADASAVGTLGYSLFLIAGPDERLYLYRATSGDCASQ